MDRIEVARKVTFDDPAARRFILIALGEQCYVPE